jgi:hypothetical protein
MTRRTSQRLARQAIETSVAAPLVVAHRLSRMATAGSPLSARDRTEFSRMGMEKVWAFHQSWAAMGMQMAANQFDLMRAMTTTLVGASLGQRSSSSALHAAWSAAANRMLSAGLAPVHKAATANARRLSRSRAR